MRHIYETHAHIDIHVTVILVKPKKFLRKYEFSGTTLYSL